MTVNGQGDEKINPEGLASFKFDRPVIPTVLAETPVQNRVPAVSHAELEEAVQREELSEEEVESEEDEGTDEAEKWFVPEGYTAVLDAPAASQLNSSIVGVHLLFKRNGVGWCH
eukprot:gene32946-42032_t